MTDMSTPDPLREARSMLRAVSVAGALSLLITFVWLVAPLGSSAGSALLGSSFYIPDDLLNLAILEWGRVSLVTGQWNVFQWPAGFPITNSLAGTETLLGWQWLYTPARAVGLSMVGAINLCVIVSFGISGAAAALMAGELGVPVRGTVVAGLVFALSPLHVGLMIQFQSLALCWLPLTFWSLHRFLVTEHRSYVYLLAFSVVLTSLSSMYYGIFSVLLGFLWIVIDAFSTRRLPNRAVRNGLFLAGALMLMTMLPVVLHYLQFARTQGFNYPLSQHVARSLSLVQLTQMPDWLVLGQVLPLGTKGGAFPGVVVLALAGAAILCRTEIGGRTVTLLAFLAAICVTLSLGPLLKVHDYPALGERVLLPGRLLVVIPGLRVPSRWLSCALVFVSPLAGWGAACLLARARPRMQRLLLAIVVTAFLAESWPSTRVAEDSAKPALPLALSGAYRWLHDVQPGGISVELPSADADGASNYVMSRYVYGAVGHGQPVVSYYASHQLPLLSELQAAAERLPSPDALALLKRSGVMRVILHKPLMKLSDYNNRTALLKGAAYRVEFDGNDAIVFGWP